MKPNFQLHPLHEAMLMECCEGVAQPPNTERHGDEVLVLAILQAFETSIGLMKGLIKGILPEFGDVLTLNYRGETFTLDKHSPVVKDALKNT